MRAPILALIAGLAVGSAGMSAQATPVAPVLGSDSKPGIVQVWGGCGWGFHPNRWGHCVPNRWGTIGRIDPIGGTTTTTVAATIRIGADTIGTDTEAARVAPARSLEAMPPWSG